MAKEKLVSWGKLQERWIKKRGGYKLLFSEEFSKKYEKCGYRTKTILDRGIMKILKRHEKKVYR